MMLTITAALYRELENGQRRQYVMLLCDLIRRELHVDTDSEQVIRFIERARRVGLSGERDTAAFVVTATALVIGAPDLPADWIEQWLSACDPSMPAPRRADLMVRTAAAFLQAR